MKKILVKIFWFLLLISKYLKSFLRYLKNNFYLIVINPDFRIYKRIISYRLVVIMIILLMGMFFLSFNFALDQRLNEGLTSEKEKNILYNKHLKEFENIFVTINNYHATYKTEFNSIFNEIGSGKTNTFDVIDDKTIVNQLDFSQSEQNNKTLEIINLNKKLNNALNSLKENVLKYQLLENYFAIKNNFFKKIPNGWPLKANIGYKTSGFGLRPSVDDLKEVEFHNGVDISAFKGSEIIATADGVISFVGEKSRYGNLVIIRHDYNFKTVYAHNDKNLVKLFQRVKKGQIIALLGNSGRSTGSHVHYEIRLENKFVDPWPYIIVKF